MASFSVEQPQNEAGFRAERIAKAVLLAIGLALAFTVLTAQQGDAVSGRLGGDFPAFYGAARIVNQGDAAQLYDANVQVEAQADLWDTDDFGLLYFAYPPYVAALYTPLAWMSYPMAYGVHTAIMAGLVVFALHLVKPMVREVRDHWWVALATIASFFPLFRGFTAGQNTAVTLFLVVAFWRLLEGKRDVQAGLVLALLLFKPQFAIPLAGVALLSGRRRVLAGMSLGGFGLWLTSALWLGTYWLGAWWGNALDFARLDAQTNARNSVSAPGFSEALGGGLLATLGWVIAALVALSLSWVWWRRRDVPLAMLVALAGPSIVLLSPHAMFYDSSLMVLSLATLPAIDSSRQLRWIAIVWALGLTHLLSTWLGWSPLFIVVFGVWAWTFWKLFSEPASAPQLAGAGLASTSGVLDRRSDR